MMQYRRRTQAVDAGRTDYREYIQVQHERAKPHALIKSLGTIVSMLLEYVI
jgi:hypothetical protein